MFFRRFLIQAPEGEGSGSGATSQVDGAAAGSKSEIEGASGGTAQAGSGETGAENAGGGELDVSKLDAKAQKLIKDLRKENADARKRNKNLDESHGKLKSALVAAGIIENDDEAPEAKLKSVTEQNALNVFNSAVLESAIEHGVVKADLSFFRYLVQEKVQSLEEGEELDAEVIAELANQARRSQGAASGSTSVNTSKETPAPGAKGSVTLDQFIAMNMSEKTDLYLKNEALYTRLIGEAKAKKLIA